MMPKSEDDIVTVQNTDYMDSDLFRKHINTRHRASLGGRKAIFAFRNAYIEQCYRTFHDTIHRLYLNGDMDHDHGA